MTIFLLILGLLLFIGLVVVHELGHFIVARRNGVEAEEFGIGFPPALWKKRIKSKKGDFDFSINALPLGGFVKLKGEHDEDSGKGSFGAASLKVKAKIMLAGVVMNLIVAFVLFTILALVGMPKLISKDSGFINEDQFTIASDERLVAQHVVVAQVEPDSPAAQAGLKQFDQIAAIGLPDGAKSTIGYVVKPANASTDFQALSEVTKQYAGQTVTIEYRRDNVLQQTQTQLRSTADIEASKNDQGVATKGYLGVVPSQYQASRYTWSAPVVAAGLTVQITKLTFQALGSSLSGLGQIIAGAVTLNSDVRKEGQTKASEQVSGPLGIFFVLKAGANQGVIMVLFIIALISLSLAIMNILPIPALDGGRLYLTLLFRGLKKPLTQDIEEKIVGTSFLLLMILFVLITIVDAKRFF